VDTSFENLKETVACGSVAIEADAHVKDILFA
jgi:hypothetical protein